MASLEYETRVARDLVQRAFEASASSPNQNLFSRIFQRLDQIKVKTAPEGRDFPYCLKNLGATGFHQKRNMNAIHICNFTLTMSTDHIAQTIIHETIHSLDIYDECETSRAEVAIMRASRGKVAYRNKYWRSCGIN